MKKKVKGKVLKKIKREKVKHICYFCGSTKRITKHHKIFKVFLQGQVLDDNIEYLCEKCHRKFHLLAKPVINALVKAIVEAQPKATRQIGFKITNGKGKKNDRSNGTKK